MEMISELFKHLQLKDLAACSLVNKHWHSIYAAFKVHSLVAFDDRYFFDFRKWYDSNQTIREEELCPPWMFVRLVEKPLLSNLRHLILASPFEFDLNKLNRFSELVHLEIKMDGVGGEINLNLSKLKVLALHGFNNDCALSIDSPLLITLLYKGREANQLEVKQPETIRKLDTNMVGPKLDPFKSVECLVTREFGAISKATLLLLPSLKELHYNEDIELFFAEESHNGPGAVDRLKQTMNEFLDEAKNLRGSDFHFTLAGFQLHKVNADQIDFGVDVNDEDGVKEVSNEYVYMTNYHLIEPGALHFVRSVNYTDLMSNVSGEFPRCFSQKFTGIKSVKATEVPDADHLLWFLKSLRSLKELELEETELSQEFYDLLPASAPSLISLTLEDGYCEDGLQMNFNFISKLSRLLVLEIESVLFFESLPSLVRSVGKLQEVSFGVQLRKELFSVTKTGLKWTIKKADVLQFKTRDPDRIVDFFQLFQNMSESSASDSQSFGSQTSESETPDSQASDSQASD